MNKRNDLKLKPGDVIQIAEGVEVWPLNAEDQTVSPYPKIGESLFLSPDDNFVVIKVNLSVSAGGYGTTTYTISNLSNEEVFKISDSEVEWNRAKLVGRAKQVSEMRPCLVWKYKVPN